MPPFLTSFPTSRIIMGAAALMLAIVMVAPLPARAANDDAARQFVKETSEQALSIIGDKSIDQGTREAQFTALLRAKADMKRIAAFALGQFIRLPTPEQKTEYLGLVENFVVKVYLTRLADYSDEKLIITDTEAKGTKEVIVKSKIEFTNGREPVTVDWWLLKDGGSYRIFDVNVVGIWLAQEQRSTFTSVINSNNGDFNALLNHLKTQIAKADAGGDTTNASK
ncbi:MAG: ABC transporter substrate-binding protein [Parvibaculum sp.]